MDEDDRRHRCGRVCGLVPERRRRQGGIPYRLWLRLRAQNNDWANDSVFVQFSGSVDASSAPTYRIGTTSAATVNLEDFSTTGPQRLRVQTREDGLTIDQIVLSRGPYLNKAPGALKNDTTIIQP